MELSLFLAKLLGVYLVALTPAVVINRHHFSKFIEETEHSFTSLHLGGLISFLVGLLIILTHNVWVWDWRVLITIFGWLVIAKGLLLFYLPTAVQVLALKFTPAMLALWCIPFFIAGVYLLYVGFGL